MSKLGVEHLMSIGALAKATGVPADTLRTWERRYGFPEAERTDSGHRRYSLHTLERLRRVLKLIAQGHRPSAALGADDATLLQWLAADGGSTSLANATEIALPSTEDEDETVERWLGHVERYEGRALSRELRVSSGERGTVAFLDRLLSPFLQRVGERWAEGSLSVAHEHFASERVQELLAQSWRPLSDAATGAMRVCATPPGEQHVLGLHMAALVLAQHNSRVVFLGANVPVADIVRATEHHTAEAALLSAAEGSDDAKLHDDLRELRHALPAGVTLVARGRGVLTVPLGVTRLRSFEELASWVRSAG